MNVTIILIHVTKLNSLYFVSLSSLLIYNVHVIALAIKPQQTMLQVFPTHMLPVTAIPL